MIKKYLSYLQDISRKIISDSGFEKALLDRGRVNKSFTCQIAAIKNYYSPHDELYSHLRIIEEYLSKNIDKKLFCGFGIVIGTKGRQYAAPLIFAECTILNEDSEISIEIDFDTSSFNYDLLTNVLNYGKFGRVSVADDEEFNEDLQNEVDIVDSIENEILSFDSFSKLKEYSKKIFVMLQQQLNDFDKIELSNDEFDFDIENELFSKKPKKGQVDKRKRKSLFEENLRCFIGESHLFVNSVPHQLSTFEALHKLISEVNENEFQNQVLEKLLTNVLTSSRAELSYNESADIEKILLEKVPLKFSDSQIASIKNAFSSDISYIQGPPGTGKSYTISAIILCAVYLNKKVLLVSQKDAALGVIPKMIEKFFSREEKSTFKGITYYMNANRNELKNNIDYLLSQWQNQKKLSQQLNALDEEIKGAESKLSKLNKDHGVYQSKLADNLQKEYSYLQKYNEFIKLRDRFATQKNLPEDLRITENYKFQKRNINNRTYENYLATIDLLREEKRTIVGDFYKYKFRNHLSDNFSIKSELLDDGILYEYSKDLIEMHLAFSDMESVEQNSDSQRIRENIDYLEKEIKDSQSKLLQKKYRFRILQNLSENFNKKADDYRDNLDKLGHLLYWKKPSKIATIMQEIDYSMITDLMPFWLAETRYLGQILPMTAEMFDIVIVDESSQVNLAEVLPAFYRGKKICIVGDHNQLGLDSTGVNFKLSNRFDNLIWEKNFVNTNLSYATATEKQLTVTKCSILDFVRSPSSNVSIRSEMLKEHFRSMPSLANYTNTNYYDGLLRIMTETPERMGKDCFKVIKLEGFRDEKDKTIKVEADKIVAIIQELTSANMTFPFDEKIVIPNLDQDRFSIGIISLLTEQRNLIENLIEEKISDEIKEKHKIEVWTPQSAQGNEKDVIIISLCLDITCTGGGNYYKNVRRLNVATSRAKQYTIVVHCDFQHERYSQLAKYLNLTSNKMEWTLNHNAYESEFEYKVYHYLKHYTEERQILADIRIFNQVETCGQKRLDFVVYNQSSDMAVAIEVDGSYHYSDNGITKFYSKEHIERIDILKRAGWTVINTPYYKWYKNGWLCDENHPTFKKELNRIFSELDLYLSI